MISLFIIILSLLIGSFLNVCIARIPQEKSVATPRSHCPQCKKTLSFYDLIPILSFLLLKGKCRHCKAQISWKYPLVEFITALGTTILFLQFSLTPTFYALTFIYYLLIVITFIDLKHYIIPDVISLPGIVIGIGLSFFGVLTNTTSSVLGLLIGGGILYLMGWLYHFFKKQDGMGGGDIKLMAMLGSFLGYKAITFILFMSSILGAVGGIVTLLILRKEKGTPIPFGPYIALAFLMYVFFGTEIINWYLGSY